MGRSHHPLRLYEKPPPPELAERFMRYYDSREMIDHPDHFPTFTSEAMFGVQAAPLSLDIGCSTGEFLLPLACRHPDQCFVGVDRAAKPLHRVVYDADKAAVRNVKLIKGDARLLLPLMPTASLSAVYYHFPHPYVKARTRRTGIFIPEFLAGLHPKIKPTGYLNVLTDSEATWEYMQETMMELPQYRVNSTGPYRLEIDDGLKSFYHRKWEQQARRIYRMELYPQ